jgi:hypothetical protein
MPLLRAPWLCLLMGKLQWQAPAAQQAYDQSSQHVGVALFGAFSA